MELPVLRSRGAVAVTLLIAALLLRVVDFGNPVIHVDEQYYLLVGDRMLHGAVPYLDIWDRKPVGLFALFAAIRLLPGDGILAYQIVASLFAAATAWVVAQSARRVGATPLASLMAGVAYLIWLSLLNGRGGQSPVFYNLPIAIGGLLTLRLPDLARHRAHGAILRNGIAACLLAGFAIQMKYTPAIEGAFFGAAHLWFLRRSGARGAAIMTAGAVWLVAGLAPTLLVIAYYADLGSTALGAFWFANVTSITLRPGYPAGQLAMRLLGIAAQLSPLLVSIVISWRVRSRSGPSGERAALAFSWLGAAFAGFVAIGTWFDHYSLPLLAPMAVAAAPAWSRFPRAMIASLGLAATLFVVELAGRRDDGAGARAVAHIVAANSGHECPYVFIGDTITYRLADACLPTRYAFPNFLAYATEQGATGIDEAAEVRRILDTRPPVIVTSTRRLDIWNPISIRLIKARLARAYRPVFSAPHDGYRTMVYLRDDRPFRR